MRVAVSRLRLVLEAETASRQTLELTRTVGSLLPESSSVTLESSVILAALARECVWDV